jgi:UTP:GlnB (protein PII) uridylyltransferase
MIDFSYKKDADLIELSIRTDATKIGTLFRIVACLFVLKMDILSGEVQTIEEGGILYTLDNFTVRSLDENADSAFQLGVLMDTAFSKYEDATKLLEEYNLGEPDPKLFFKDNFEFIFTDDPETNTTCFYMESKNARGLLYHITRILMKNQINIISAKVETNSESNLAMDRFYIRDSENRPVSQNRELIEKIKREIKGVD